MTWPRSGRSHTLPTCITREEALAGHLGPRPGKFDIGGLDSRWRRGAGPVAGPVPPGVAVPVEVTLRAPWRPLYDYTPPSRATRVAVISNGTGDPGHGNSGALARSAGDGGATRVLFQALLPTISAVDIELDTEDPDEIINAVKLMGPTFGGINLEDIKAPECFIIEQRLKELMDIPVFTTTSMARQ